MKNLSKELCKLCDIEPIKISKCQYYNEYHFDICTGDDICEYTDNITISCKDCKKSKIKKIYPNFELPENFVMLYETMTKDRKMSVGALVNCGKQVNNRKEFLGFLIKALSYIPDKEDKEIYKEMNISTWENDIKQAIKKQKWIIDFLNL